MPLKVNSGHEVSRCRRLLGVNPGDSLEEVNLAYRDLVQVWHPDRFSTNERLQSMAEERLKEINLAYEYLLASGFINGLLCDPSESDTRPAAPPHPEGNHDGQPNSALSPEIEPFRRGLGRATALGLLAVALLGVGAFLHGRSSHGGGPSRLGTSTAPDTSLTSKSADIQAAKTLPVSERIENEPALAKVAADATAWSNSINQWHESDARPAIHASRQTFDPAASPAAIDPRAPKKPSMRVPAQARPNTSLGRDMLDSMIPVNGEKVSRVPEGTLLESTENEWEYIESNELFTPPFTIRARVKLDDWNDFRLYFGLGRVVFNWRDNTNELRLHSPIDGAVTPVPARGSLPPKSWHELVWEIAKTSMIVAVDGETRFRDDGDYAALKAHPGLGLLRGSALVQSFMVETRRLSEPAPPPGRNRGPLRGDMLSVLVPQKNVTVTPQPDGLLLATNPGADRDICIATPQPVRAPFIIVSRVKTESTNVRLFWGKGCVILNWEHDPTEMQVTDPATGRESKIAGKGLISPNDWHVVAWDVQPGRMTVSVDGRLRYQNKGDYRAVEAKPGIGPSWSRITVDYFIVDKK